MDSRNRYVTQSRDPFAGSVLFGSATSPQASQAMSPVMHQTSTTPMHAMDGYSTIRSPYQGRRFGTQDSAQKSARGLRSETKRPPLASILDDKMSILSSNTDAGGEFLLNRTPGSITLEEEKNPFANDTGRSFNSTQKFPLNPSSSVRNDLGSRGGASSNPFASPVPARPPLRSTLDVFSGGRSAIDRLDQYSSESNHLSDASTDKAALSPILTLGPYKPAMDRIDAAWCSWVVVSGFYPSAAGRDAVLQLFSQFGDIVDHVLTSGNYLYIKYSSPVHTERAASQHGAFLNEDTLLSVLVLNPRLAQHMGLTLSRDGSLQVSNALLPGKKTSELQDLLGLDSGSGTPGGPSGLGGGLRQRTTGAASSATLGQSMARDGAQGSLDEVRGLMGNIEEREAAARRARAQDAPELYLQPSRRKNICERVVEYFFSY